MDTTTPDGGATAQPEQTSAAVSTEDQGIPIVTDENGTPSLADTSQPSASEASEAVSESAPAEPVETQAEEQVAAADKSDEDIVAWSEKKGLSINPENPNEVKLARMQLEAERKMHEARQIPSPEPPEVLPVSEDTDPAIQQVIDIQNETNLKLYVRDWFDAHPDAKENREQLQQIAEQRPWLSNLDDVYAHFLADPNYQAKVRQEAGVQALTNLAQKQQAIPPSSGASPSQSFESQTITPQNVYDLVDKNDQSWFEKNHDAISRAMSQQ